MNRERLDIARADEPLTALDSVFLYLESARTPMHSASVGIFEGRALTDRAGRLRIEDLRREIEERLDSVPKLRRRVVFGTMGELAPRWVDDSKFDIENHVKQVALPAPATESELTTLCAELVSIPLDREHPLWEMWFIEGLDGGKVALLEKLHHAMADGLAGVELATVLLDTHRHRPPASCADARSRIAGEIQKNGWHPRPAESEARAVAQQLVRSAVTPLRAVRRGWAAARHPLRGGRHLAGVLDGFGALLGPRTIAPRSFLNRQICTGRHIAFVRQPLEGLRMVEERFGVTLNDVVLTAVANAMGELYEARGVDAKDRSLQVLVPVGADHNQDHRLGNRVSAMVPRLPVSNTGVVATLHSVAREMSRCKRHHEALAGTALITSLGVLPQPLLSIAARLVHRQPFVNLVVTNVPGTPFPLYAMGAKMLEAFPIVPLAGNLSIGVAVLSYDAQLTLGIISDREGAEDLEILVAAVQESFAELVRAATPENSSPRTSRHRRVDDEGAPRAFDVDGLPPESRLGASTSPSHDGARVAGGGAR